MACSWDSTTSAGPRNVRSPSAPCGLHHAAVGREVATQHGQTAFGDRRMVDIVDGAVDTVTIERIEQRGVRPRFRGDDVARSPRYICLASSVRVSRMMSQSLNLSSNDL